MTARVAPSPAILRLQQGPILSTLLRLAAPNVIAMAMQVLAAIAETIYVGRLGTVPLAAMALVFPFIMLAQQLSAGAMGGGVSSAISRALGASDLPRARALAFNGLAIGTLFGLVFTIGMLMAGPTFYRWLGGTGAVLQQASAYSGVLFFSAVLIWISNTLASILRGTGNMLAPSLGILAAALLQIAVGGTLAFGAGPIPPLGLGGIAIGYIVANGASATLFTCYLLGTRSRLHLALATHLLRRDMVMDILKVGAVSMLSPLQTVLTVVLLTGFVARLGTLPLAGYAIGQRIEFLLIPIAFGIGVAAIPMVGMAIGTGAVARARKVAWTAAAMSAVNLGIVGATVALFPDLWAGLFTRDEAVLTYARQYLRIAGPAFAFFGAGLTLYFASQGSGKMVLPVLAGTARLALVAAAGSWLAAHGGTSTQLFGLVAASMVLYGLAGWAAVRCTRWGPLHPGHG